MKFTNFIILCFSLCILSSCASYKAARQPDLSYNLEAQENKVDKEGVTLMTKCIQLQSEMKIYFDDDLLQYGILPVQISLKNNSYPKTLVFNTDAINLINPTGVRSSIMSYDQVIDKAKKSYWRSAGWTVAFGIVGAIPSLINVSNTNEKIRADYESRMLKSGNLIVGSETEGLAFFSVPENLNSLNDWKISVVLKDVETNNDFILDYALSGDIVPPKERKQYEGEIDHEIVNKKENKSEVKNQRLIEEREKNRMALIPQTSLQTQKRSKFKMAILPGSLNNSSVQWISNEEITVYIEDALNKAINSNQLFVPKFSYYDLKNNRSEKISDDILNKDATDHLWLKERFSKSKEPNVGLICQLGEKLQVDAILTYFSYTYTESNEAFGDFTVSLINVKTKKYYSEKQTCHIRYGLDKDFEEVIRKLYTNFEKDSVEN